MAQQEQGAEALRSRYAGRPLLVLIENYVLSCIGCLTSDKEEKMLKLVQKAYGGGEDWKRTLRPVLLFEDSIDEDLRQMWESNKQLARASQTQFEPEDFARAVADKNFGHLF
jgi:hypothetical protein